MYYIFKSNVITLKKKREKKQRSILHSHGHFPGSQEQTACDNLHSGSSSLVPSSRARGYGKGHSPIYPGPKLAVLFIAWEILNLIDSVHL